VLVTRRCTVNSIKNPIKLTTDWSWSDYMYFLKKLLPPFINCRRSFFKLCLNIRLI
jgi:hypothetical protein